MVDSWRYFFSALKDHPLASEEQVECMANRVADFEMNKVDFTPFTKKQRTLELTPDLMDTSFAKMLEKMPTTLPVEGWLEVVARSYPSVCANVHMLHDTI